MSKPSSSTDLETKDYSSATGRNDGGSEGQCDPLSDAASFPAAAPPYHHHPADADADEKGGDFRFQAMNNNGTNIIMMRNTSSTSASRTGGNREIIEIMEEDEEMITSSSRNNDSSRIIPYQSTSLFSIDINNSNMRWSSSDGNNNNVVYVGVGKSDSSSGALMWALNNAVTPGTTLVYLVHVFSEIKFIPSPLGGGRVPKSQVSRDLVESYDAQERSKRRELLTNYVDKCTAHLVQVETILIESDSVANAIAELISVLNIPNLILGISTSNLRRMRSGKWNGSIVAEHVLRSAPPGCEVKIICKGKDIMLSELGEISSSPISAGGRIAQVDEHLGNNHSFSCCFRPTPNE